MIIVPSSLRVSTLLKTWLHLGHCLIYKETFSFFKNYLNSTYTFLIKKKNPNFEKEEEKFTWKLFLFHKE